MIIIWNEVGIQKSSTTDSYYNDKMIRYIFRDLATNSKKIPSVLIF